VWGRARDVVWTLVGVGGLLYFAGWALKWVISILLLFVCSALLAFVMRPLVTWLERRLSLSRGRAALLAYAAVVLAVFSLGAWAVSQLAQQVAAAIASLPATYQALQERIPALESRAAEVGVNVDVRALQTRLVAEFQGSGLAAHSLEWAAAVADSAFNILIVVFLSFYLVVDGEHLATTALRVTPPRWKPHALFVQKTLLNVVGGYVRGQLIMGAIIGGSVFVACLLLGVRYSLLLGVLGFFFEMVPMVGPILIGACMTAVALLDSVHLAVFALGFYLLLQAIESNVLGPRITGHAVGLHPIAAMLGLVAGGKLFGLWGALFAVPVLGFLFVIAAAVYRQVLGLNPEDVLRARRPARPWRPWRLRPSSIWPARWRHERGRALR
jgi:predicted PurR-regulated permease PerM